MRNVEIIEFLCIYDPRSQRPLDSQLMNGHAAVYQTAQPRKVHLNRRPKRAVREPPETISLPLELTVSGAYKVHRQLAPIAVRVSRQITSKQLGNRTVLGVDSKNRRLMSRRATKTEKLISFLSERGLIRTRELASAKIDRKILQRACARGLVARVGRGAYRLPGVRVDPIVSACKQVPKGVVCLHSALAFYGLVDAEPAEIWMAIGPKERIPQSVGAQITFVRFSGEALTQGVQNLKLGGVPVRVYSPMKSIADCLKFRNKIGPEIARSALQASVANGSYSRYRLLHFSKICRVEKLL